MLMTKNKISTKKPLFGSVSEADAVREDCFSWLCPLLFYRQKLSLDFD